MKFTMEQLYIFPILYTINTMPADAIATQGLRTSAGINQIVRNISVALEWLRSI